MDEIKSYTDLKQSKKLAKILPITSIDFAWCIFSDGSSRLLRMDDWEVSENAKSNVEIIPCWSLTALLSVLPKHIGSSVLRMDMSENDFNLWFEDLSGTVDEILPDITKYNPIDACYEMILKLNELKML